jgi:prepilin-type N-terminal cleavage/methylation domain-containing protein
MSATFPRRGFSLIELLCVAAIIALLASLLLGAAGRAYARAHRLKVEMEAPIIIDHFRDRLRRFCEANSEFPALSAAQLFELGALDPLAIDFLRRSYVTFIPFSSAAPESVAILSVRTGRSELVLTRRDLKADE